jgi:hypothetical protein
MSKIIEQILQSNAQIATQIAEKNTQIIKQYLFKRTKKHKKRTKQSNNIATSVPDSLRDSQVFPNVQINFYQQSICNIDKPLKICHENPKTGEKRMSNKKIAPQTFRIANPPHQPFRIPSPPPKPIVQLQPLAVGSYQASEMLGISVGFLRKLTKEGIVPHKKLGSKVVYSVEELKKFLAKAEEVKTEE